MVYGSASLESAICSVRCGPNPCERRADHDRPVSDSRVHERGPGRGQFRLHDTWVRHARLGLDVSSYVVLRSHRQIPTQSPTQTMIRTNWNRRISRAAELTSSFPFAAEGLRYYARVATFQRSLYAEIDKALADSPKISSARPLRDELDLFLLLPNFSRFLSLIEQIAPAPLAQAAAGLARKGTPGWQHAIEDFWHGDLETPMAMGATEEEWEGGTGGAKPREQLLAWIFLQPYAEYLADQRKDTIVDGAPSTCPLCGGKPIVGVLRSEGDGAKKSLICMLCA